MVEKILRKSRPRGGFFSNKVRILRLFAKAKSAKRVGKTVATNVS